jgi:hypothetical protein
MEAGFHETCRQPYSRAPKVGKHLALALPDLTMTVAWFGIILGD